MKYLEATSYDALLHYKDRAPTFVRLFIRLLESYEFLKLSDLARGHLMQLWLLAAKLDNKIPLDADFIARQLRARSKIDLQALVDSGFFRVIEHSASNVLAESASKVLADASTASDLKPPESGELLATRYQEPRENREAASNLLADASTLPILVSKDLSSKDLRSTTTTKDQDQELCDSASNLLAPASAFEMTIEPDEQEISTALVTTSRRKTPELPVVLGPRTLPAIRAQLAQVLDEVAQGTRTRITREQQRRLLAGIVVGYWMAKFNHPKALVDDKRERVIVARLRENGDNLGELLFAFDGAAKDQYVNGEKDGTKHDDIEFLLRNRGNVERFANLSKRYRAGEPHPTAEKYKAILAGDAPLNGNGVHHE
jgi:hypothetical protein